MSEMPSKDEARAAQRYTIINLLRLGSVGAVAGGIAIAQGAVSAPYAVGVALAIAGVAAFFFGPPLLAKRWKAGDRRNS